MIYLKANNEEELLSSLTCWKKTNNEDDVEYIEFYSSTHSLDVIGVIYKETGVILTDEEGMEYPETTTMPGWHANLLLHGENMPQSLNDFVIGIPTNPIRRFA
jgi:hypothetical protein